VLSGGHARGCARAIGTGAKPTQQVLFLVIPLVYTVSLGQIYVQRHVMGPIARCGKRPEHPSLSVNVFLQQFEVSVDGDDTNKIRRASRRGSHAIRSNCLGIWSYVGCWFARLSRKMAQPAH
jgi:hypothetical protein